MVLTDVVEIEPTQPENPYFGLANGQRLCRINNYTLESGEKIQSIPIAFKTWGKLNETRDNCMVICHALTGSSDVADWWGPLLGRGKAFDTSKFFIFCANVTGSPYGSMSPCTADPTTGVPYGPTFPTTTIRDDVNLHKMVLDYLGINKVAICIGGSLGGMQALEWAMFGKAYVRYLVAIATSGKHSAWGISWGEAQRQAIYSDPKFINGNYAHEDPPKAGLSAARMSALLTYRSRDSFESRFGRKRQLSRPNSTTKLNTGSPKPDSNAQVFTAQSYLRYQGDKFVNRFDANCYVALTSKMDLHDLASNPEFEKYDYINALRTIDQPTVIVGIESDGLFTINEQYELADLIENAELKLIESNDGHDGFLLEFVQLNKILKDFVKLYLPNLYGEPDENEEEEIKVESLVGEVEGDIVEW